MRHAVRAGPAYTDRGVARSARSDDADGTSPADGVGGPRGANRGPAVTGPRRAETHAPRRPPAGGRCSRIDGPLVVTGDIVGDDELVVEGKVIGSIRARVVVIGRRGQVDAGIVTNRLVIEGRFFGHAQARDVELLATAQVSGTVIHSDLRIEKGAVVDGLMPWRPSVYFDRGGHEYEIVKRQSRKPEVGAS